MNYRGYFLAHNPMSDMVHIHQGDEHVETVRGIGNAEATVDSYLDAR